VRVLVTGAAGFVGSHIVRRCLRAGYEVAALVRPATGLARLSDIQDRFALIRCDLNASVELLTAVEAASPEICIHAAWHVPPGRYLHAPENLTSVAASTSLLLALKSTPCRRIVFVGSCAEYAPSDRCVDEESGVGPTTLYGTCKHAVSLLIEQCAREIGWSSVTARLFNTYGPQEPGVRLVPSLITALLDGNSCALTSGTQVRDFLHVDDVADAIWTIASSELRGVVNVAASVPLTVADVAREVARQIGRPDLIGLGTRPHPEEDPQWLCAKAGTLRGHGWVPRYDLASGLEDTIGWWRRELRGGVSAVSRRRD
jgi:nucleoside-diphosphate-sugar epimerase